MCFFRSLSTSDNQINIALLNACASKCVNEALLKADMSLLEPMMLLEVTLLGEAGSDSNSKAVLHELSKRQAIIDDIEHDIYGKTTFMGWLNT